MSSRAASSPVSEPRGVPRHKVFLPAEMVAQAGSARVHLLNISPAGALLHADDTPRPGATVQIKCAGASWLARVVWAQHKRFGVVHSAPMALATLDQLLASQRR